MSLKDDLLGLVDCQAVPFDVPEWGRSVYLKVWDSGTRNAVVLRVDSLKTATPEQIDAYFAVMSVCDEAGNLVFTEADVPALLRKNGKAIARIALRVLDLNKVDAADEAKKN